MKMVVILNHKQQELSDLVCIGSENCREHETSICSKQQSCIKPWWLPSHLMITPILSHWAGSIENQVLFTRGTPGVTNPMHSDVLPTHRPRWSYESVQSCSRRIRNEVQGVWRCWMHLENFWCWYPVRIEGMWVRWHVHAQWCTEQHIQCHHPPCPLYLNRNQDPDHDILLTSLTFKTWTGPNAF